jgi:hypothetical protein
MSEAGVCSLYSELFKTWSHFSQLGELKQIQFALNMKHELFKAITRGIFSAKVNIVIPNYAYLSVLVSSASVHNYLLIYIMTDNNRRVSFGLGPLTFKDFTQ